MKLLEEMMKGMGGAGGLDGGGDVSEEQVHRHAHFLSTSLHCPHPLPMLLLAPRACARMG